MYHYLMIKFAEGVSPETATKAMEKNFSTMPGTINGLVSCKVFPNMVKRPGNIDAVVRMEFTSEKELWDYLNSDSHKAAKAGGGELMKSFVSFDSDILI